MKYKSSVYAKALVDIMQKEKDNAKMVAGFLEFVKKNRDEKKLKEILKLAEKMYFKKTGNKKIVLETARHFNFKNSKLVENLVKKGDVVAKKINNALIAGVKIVVNEEKQLDFSMQKLISEIV
mgnify:CR=1 FL=1